MKPTITCRLSEMTFIMVCMMLGLRPVFAEVEAAKETPVMSNIHGSYLKSCKGVIRQQSGLCLLTSTSPKSTNGWLIKSKDQSKADQRVLDKPVTPNEYMAIAPGNYFLYSSDGFDSGGHELQFTVNAGEVTTLKTATFKAARKGLGIRHYQPSSGIKGAGCIMRTLNSNVIDVLPGNYLVYMENSAKFTLPCPPGGVAINAIAGQAQRIGSRSYRVQWMPSSATYRHPNGLSSLTSISQFREDIQQMGILSKWDSINELTNPYPTKYSALVLLGLGTRTYIVPFTRQNNKAVCGRSIAKGGLAALPLLTNCKFVGGRLVDFRVQAGGSYFTVNNRHGVPTIEANNINNSILVEGLRAETP